MATDTTRHGGHMFVEGNFGVGGTMPERPRTELVQDANQIYTIPWEAWRIWDAFGTNLPATPASDDLGLVGGTWGSATPSIQTGDLKAAGSTTRRARVTFQIPPEYDTGQTVTIRARAGMLTTIADNAATIDFEVYRSSKEAGLGSDLVTTSATTINSTTLGNKDFVVSPATLAPGDILDIRMSVLVNDAATGTAVTGCVGGVDVLLDIRG